MQPLHLMKRIGSGIKYLWDFLVGSLGKWTQDYSHHLDHKIVAAITPVLTGVAFYIETQNQASSASIIIGVVVVVFLSLHQSAVVLGIRESKKDVLYLERKLRDKEWLLKAIRSLVNGKLTLLRSDDNFDGTKVRKESLYLILQMIHEFYANSEYQAAPSTLRIVYQELSDDGTYLTVKYWYYGDGRTPSYAGNPDLEREFFSLENLGACPVRSWVESKPCIFESPDEITYFSPSQREFVKSLFSYTFCGGSTREKVGVVTLSSDRPSFFKRDEEEDHVEIVKEFALRFDMEREGLRRAEGKGQSS